MSDAVRLAGEIFATALGVRNRPICNGHFPFEWYKRGLRVWGRFVESLNSLWDLVKCCFGSSLTYTGRIALWVGTLHHIVFTISISILLLLLASGGNHVHAYYLMCLFSRSLTHVSNFLTSLAPCHSWLASRCKKSTVHWIELYRRCVNKWQVLWRARWQ